MKRLVSTAAMLFMAALAFSQDATVLLNVSAKRPLFNLERDGKIVSRTLSPGSRISVDPASTLSGLGLKKTPLGPGVYYFADLDGSLQVYALQSNQVLVYNDSRSTVRAKVDGQASSESELIQGNFLLAEIPKEGTLRLILTNEDSTTEQTELKAGVLYKIELTTDESGKTHPSAQIW